jgi:hypothetical protein
MNFREWGAQYLDQRAVGAKDAAAIVEAAFEENAAMKEVAHRSIEGYPVSMRAVFALLLNRAALTWIDANCPKAWYRSMFDGTADKLARENPT